MVGASMSWGEASRLTQRLATDPSTQVGAALAGWDYPLPHDALVLMDLFDLFARTIAGVKDARYPRPWPDVSEHKIKPTVPQDVVIAALQMAGHTGLPPLAS